ncbi:hypothetical protein C8R43DRAFT_963132 [Mycena crocata]|nr:hypothetical protein C8R43DRAFT_963132 [Mycena crocata]
MHVTVGGVRFNALSPKALKITQDNHSLVRIQAIRRREDMQLWARGSMTGTGSCMPMGGKLGDGYAPYACHSGDSVEDIEALFRHAVDTDILITAAKTIYPQLEQDLLEITEGSELNRFRRFGVTGFYCTDFLSCLHRDRDIVRKKQPTLHPCIQLSKEKCGPNDYNFGMVEWGVAIRTEENTVWYTSVSYTYISYTDHNRVFNGRDVHGTIMPSQSAFNNGAASKGKHDTNNTKDVNRATACRNDSSEKHDFIMSTGHRYLQHVDPSDRNDVFKESLKYIAERKELEKELDKLKQSSNLDRMKHSSTVESGTAGAKSGINCCWFPHSNLAGRHGSSSILFKLEIEHAAFEYYRSSAENKQLYARTRVHHLSAYFLTTMLQKEDRIRTIAGYLLKNNARLILTAAPEVAAYVKAAVLQAFNDDSLMICNVAGQDVVAFLSQLEPRNWPKCLQQLMNILDSTARRFSPGFGDFRGSRRRTASIRSSRHIVFPESGYSFVKSSISVSVVPSRRKKLPEANVLQRKIYNRPRAAQRHIEDAMYGVPATSFKAQKNIAASQWFRGAVSNFPPASRLIQSSVQLRSLLPPRSSLASGLAQRRANLQRAQLPPPQNPRFYQAAPGAHKTGTTERDTAIASGLVGSIRGFGLSARCWVNCARLVLPANRLARACRSAESSPCAEAARGTISACAGKLTAVLAAHNARSAVIRKHSTFGTFLDFTNRFLDFPDRLLHFTD